MGSGRFLARNCSPTPVANLFAAFGTPNRLAAYAGLAPVPRDSGRVQGNLRRPKRYHRALRRVFYLAALSAMKRENSPSRAFYG